MHDGNLQDDWRLKLAQPAQRALAAAGYEHLEQLAETTEKELLRLHGLGPKTIRQLREMLTAKGLSFADKTASS